MHNIKIFYPLVWGLDIITPCRHKWKTQFRKAYVSEYTQEAIVQIHSIASKNLLLMEKGSAPPMGRKLQIIHQFHHRSKFFKYIFTRSWIQLETDFWTVKYVVKYTIFCYHRFKVTQGRCYDAHLYKHDSQQNLLHTKASLWIQQRTLSPCPKLEREGCRSLPSTSSWISRLLR